MKWTYTAMLIAFVGVNVFGETATIYGRSYEHLVGKWYQIDGDQQYEVIADVITIKPKADVKATQIDDYNSAHGITIIRKNILGFYDLKIPSGADPIDMAQQYQASGLVEVAEPNTYGQYTETPDDSLYPNQWSLNQANDCDIDAPEAWNIEFGDAAVRVGILDSGTEILHKDLKTNI